MGPGVGVAGPRFPNDGRPGMTQSRQALTNMLRQRHPGVSATGQFVPGPAAGAPVGAPPGTRPLSRNDKNHSLESEGE